MNKLILLFIIFFAGCSSKYDECLEQQKFEYRTRNPNASYSQIQSRQAEFELMCNKYKTK